MPIPCLILDAAHSFGWATVEYLIMVSTDYKKEHLG